MSAFDFIQAVQIVRRDYLFYALIMAAILQADSDNVELLKRAFPATWQELDERYHNPGHHSPSVDDMGGDGHKGPESL